MNCDNLLTVKEISGYVRDKYYNGLMILSIFCAIVLSYPIPKM